MFFSEDAMGGWQKEGGGKPHERHPSQKEFWTPPRTVRFPPPPLRCQCSVFPVRADQRSLVRFPPPIRFAPLHITAQFFFRENLDSHGLRYCCIFIDLLMPLFRGAVFDHGGVPENSPLAISVNGPFRILDLPFSDFNGPSPPRMP